MNSCRNAAIRDRRPNQGISLRFSAPQNEKVARRLDDAGGRLAKCSACWVQQSGEIHNDQATGGPDFPNSGQVRMLGKPISDVAMHRDIGYLPEQPYFYDYLTAAEVLDYFAQFHDLKAADRKERVARMFKKVGLETARENSAAKIFQGNAAAGWVGASDLARSARWSFWMSRCRASIRWAGGKCATLFSS